jgi:hypothetical protein
MKKFSTELLGVIAQSRQAITEESLDDGMMLTRKSVTFDNARAHHLELRLVAC